MIGTVATWTERTMTSDKIRSSHLERKAMLYVRQSSASQVADPLLLGSSFPEHGSSYPHYSCSMPWIKEYGSSVGQKSKWLTTILGGRQVVRSNGRDSSA